MADTVIDSTSPSRGRDFGPGDFVEVNGGLEVFRHAWVAAQVCIPTIDVIVNLFFP